MSLINEVLRKLDQHPRGGGSGSVSATLRAAPGAGWGPGRRLTAVALLVFLAGVGAGVAGWWAWQSEGPPRSATADGGTPLAQEKPDAKPARAAGGGRPAGGTAGARSADPQATGRSAPGQREGDAPPLALDLPPLEGESARVQAAPPQASGPGPQAARPAADTATVKRPEPGRLKVALVPPEEQGLRDPGQPAESPAAPRGPDRQADAPASENGRVRVEVPESWQRQKEAGELARSGYRALAAQRYAEAIERLGQARRLAPGRTDVINNLGLAQWQDGRRQAAIATLTDGLRAHPGDPRMARNLAHFLVRGDDLRDREAGAELLAQVLKRQDRLPLYALVGSLFRELGRPAEAIDVYRAGIARKGAHWRLLVGLGLALEADGQSAKAKEVYRRARGQVPAGHKEVRSSLDARLKALNAGRGN